MDSKNLSSKLFGHCVDVFSDASGLDCLHIIGFGIQTLVGESGYAVLPFFDTTLPVDVGFEE